MRELSFRAWDEKYKFMTSTVTLNDIGTGFTGCNNNIVMQYTGLKDKNGVGIYEGDILACRWDGFQEFDDQPELNDEPEIREVKYCVDNDRYYPAFDLYPSVDTDSNGISYYMASGSIEVIGNIYENPNILTENTP